MVFKLEILATFWIYFIFSFVSGGGGREEESETERGGVLLFGNRGGGGRRGGGVVRTGAGRVSRGWGLFFFCSGRNVHQEM